MRQKAYYTADETFYNLYTTGSQWMTEDMVEYKGPYHSYLTGETYTEPTWKPNKSVKLVTFERPDPRVTQYKKIKPVTTTYKSIYPVYPVITDADKAAKYITRFFIKKVNESAIIEIDELQYTDWLNKKLDPNMYVAVKIIWQIAGSLTTQSVNGTLQPSVIAINQFRVKTAESAIPGITQKLSNLAELYTDTEFVTPKDINR
jgi:hypothetical protein